MGCGKAGLEGLELHGHRKKLYRTFVPVTLSNNEPLTKSNVSVAASQFWPFELVLKEKKSGCTLFSQRLMDLLLELRNHSANYLRKNAALTNWGLIFEALGKPS